MADAFFDPTDAGFERRVPSCEVAGPVPVFDEGFLGVTREPSSPALERADALDEGSAEVAIEVWKFALAEEHGRGADAKQEGDYDCEGEAFHG